MALSGGDIFAKASELGLTKGDRTGPIEVNTELARSLGINDLLKALSDRMGRKVNVMIFEDAAAVKAKSANSYRIPTTKDGF